MTSRYGIDTSVMVRLLTGSPQEEYERCYRLLSEMIEEERAGIFASNQVIGESYFVLRHHYGVSGVDAYSSLTTVLTSGLVAPLNGQAVLAALQESRGAGLVDRLIAEDYSRTVDETLTLDRQMAALAGVRRL